MGTQFSKIKVTSRIEVHGQVYTQYAPGLELNDGYPVKSNSTNDLSEELYTRRAHHSGVLSGHELLSYSFLGGQACEPRRSVRRKHRYRSSMSLPRSSSRRSSFSSKFASLKYMLPSKKNSIKECDTNSDNNSGSPDSELDSGISINGHYDQIERLRKNGLDYERIDEIKTMTEEMTLNLINRVEHQRKEPPPVSGILKKYYRDNFSDWFEPGTQLAKKQNGSTGGVQNRRASRRKNLHQKLVISQMNTKRAAKLDMDDRAKIVQYFTRPVNGAGDIAGAVESIKIEEMFGKCWGVPCQGPALPTVITVQAPAGIGKTSMLKYMCMKWGCQELWSENFDILLFVECRTLNRLGDMTGRQFLEKMLEPIKDQLGKGRYKANEGDIKDSMEDPDENSHDPFEEEDILVELSRKAAAGRVLLLLDGLDEVHGVGSLANIKMPAGHPDKPGLHGKNAATQQLKPLEFAQCLLTGSLLQGCHVIVTSRPHTLSHLQSAKWFLCLPKRMVSLDIQGLSEEGVASFIHSYVDARLYVDHENSHLYSVSNDDFERPCTKHCPCLPLRERAHSDPYVFSLATNPFYLWLICTIFTEAGEEFVPKTLTQLYTWVMLVFAHRWQNTSLSITTTLEDATIAFILNFSKLCYHLVKSGNIKIAAIMQDEGTLHFPDLGEVTIDQERAETFGLMTVSQDGVRLECEFRHLSLAEYLTALHVHVTGDNLLGFPRDRKELILQYLSGLASNASTRDQQVVRDFLAGLGSTEKKDALVYLQQVQKMKGEWYNQQGLQKQMLFMRCAFESRQEQLTIYPFPGLKVINIRGSNLLALDLITIGSFVSRLSDNNRLLELSMRDYPLDETGLRGLLPCLPLVRTVTLCARRLHDPSSYKMIGDAVGDPRSRLRELWLLEVPPYNRGLCDCPPASLYTCGRCDEVLPPDQLGKALNVLHESCRNNNVRVHV